MLNFDDCGASEGAKIIKIQQDIDLFIADYIQKAISFLIFPFFSSLTH